MRRKKLKNVTIVVLGDIGRSPRMSYHAISFAENGFNVDILGFAGSAPHQKVIQSPNITLHYLYQEKISCFFPRIVAYAVKVVLQTSIIMFSLVFRLPPCEFVLVQNPPCIPALFCCWLTSIWNGAWYVIDWHNYGYTILGLSLGENHKLVKIAHRYERSFGHLSSANLCVTKAMQKDLLENWNINATVVYDKPPDHFTPLTVSEQHDVLSRLSNQYPELKSITLTDVTSPGQDIIKSSNRPAFLISSTSWTEDEDFSILLEALDNYDSIASNKDFPNVICAITGKGPLKEYYLDIIANRKWKYVKVFTPWLEPEDYPLLIGCADLGICLHTSSSGLDLPMKVVDMFGCEVPVAAIDFNCLNELVKDGYNGVVFKDSEGLCNKLCSLLEGFPKNQQNLVYLKNNLMEYSRSSWAKNWNQHVLPIFHSPH